MPPTSNKPPGITRLLNEAMSALSRSSSTASLARGVVKRLCACDYKGTVTSSSRIRPPIAIGAQGILDAVARCRLDVA